MTGLAHRGLDAARCQHGTRGRYAGGCRCDECRAANTRYERERAAARKRGETNELVDAGPALAHLLALRKSGIGYRTVSAASCVASSIIAAILAGTRKQLRRQTERRLLAVSAQCIADHAVVPARRTQRLIDELIDEGYTKKRIARELGAQTPALQIGKRRVLAITALKVERVHRRLTE